MSLTLLAQAECPSPHSLIGSQRLPLSFCPLSTKSDDNRKLPVYPFVVSRSYFISAYPARGACNWHEDLVLKQAPAGKAETSVAHSAILFCRLLHRALDVVVRDL